MARKKDALEPQPAPRPSRSDSKEIVEASHVGTVRVVVRAVFAGAALAILTSCGDGAKESALDGVRTPWVENEPASARAQAAPKPQLPPMTTLATSASAPMSKHALAAVVSNRSAPVSKEALESALLAVGECVPGWTLFASDCRAVDDLASLLERTSGARWRPSEIGSWHLRHPAELVRYHAAQIVAREVFGAGSTRGLESEEARAYASALRSETSPKVASSMIRLAASAGHRSPVLRELFRAALENDDSLVRMAAVEALASPKVYAELADGRELLLGIMTKDPSWPVRGTACAALGGADDPSLLEPILIMMQAAETPTATRGACFEGIVRTWTSSPAPARPSREGYELTLKILRETPRDEDRPHNRGIIPMSSARNAGGFVVLADLRAALETIVLDPEAGELARDACIFTLGQWEERELLSGLAKKLAAMPDATSKRLVADATKAAAAKD